MAKLRDWSDGDRHRPIRFEWYGSSLAQEMRTGLHKVKVKMHILDPKEVAEFLEKHPDHPKSANGITVQIHPDTYEKLYPEMKQELEDRLTDIGGPGFTDWEWIDSEGEYFIYRNIK